jgi:hypothetical protein
MSETTHRALRLALASLLVAALGAQLAIGLSRSDLTLMRFLSSFTVLSNMAAVVMLAMLVARPGRDGSRGFAMWRGAVTVYMSVTGLTYVLILTQPAVDVGLTEPWVDWCLHVIGPITIALDWIMHPPPIALPGRAIGYWLIFPAAYLSYTLVRGPVANWYPYPILDPSEAGGYGAVALWSGVVLSAFLGFGLVYRWWSNHARVEPVVA